MRTWKDDMSLQKDAGGGIISIRCGFRLSLIDHAHLALAYGTAVVQVWNVSAEHDWARLAALGSAQVTSSPTAHPCCAAQSLTGGVWSHGPYCLVLG